MFVSPRKFLLLLAPVVLAYGANYQIDANIRYSKYAETVLDVLQSPAPALKNRPGVIVIHGGAWVEGSKEEMVEAFCVPLVKQDFVVANVDYRLAREAPAPAAVNDVLEAARWFRDHAEQYKVDPNQILALGASAGGELALMVAMAPASADLGPTIKIAGVIDFFGVTDLPDLLRAPHPWVPDQPGRFELLQRLSPLTYVRKGLPPMLVIHGDADRMVPYDQSVRLVKALKDAHNDAELITVTGGQHGFPPDEMNTLWPKIFKWLKKHKISS